MDTQLYVITNQTGNTIGYIRPQYDGVLALSSTKEDLCTWSCSETARVAVIRHYLMPQLKELLAKHNLTNKMFLQSSHPDSGYAIFVYWDKDKMDDLTHTQEFKAFITDLKKWVLTTPYYESHFLNPTEGSLFMKVKINP